MKTQTLIDADTASRLQAMANELGKPLTADAASISASYMTLQQK